jgi:hypothetical protein
MLCRADKSLAAQKKLDSSVCRQEISEAHLSLTQQMEMVSRMLSIMSDMLLSDGDRRKDNPRQMKQEIVEQMLKDIDKQVSDAQAVFTRSFTEKNRTSFELITRNMNEIRKTIDGIVVATGEHWKELSIQQMSLLSNVTMMSLRTESFAQSLTSLDGRMTSFSRLIGEQVLQQQVLLAERIESSFGGLQKNMSALQTHIEESVEVRLRNITSLTMPQLINDSHVQVIHLFTQHLQNESQAHQRSLIGINETWQEQHRRQYELFVSGLTNTLTLAAETAQQFVNASSQALLTHTNEQLQSSLDGLLQNITFMLQGNVTEVEDKVHTQVQRLQNQTLTALQNHHQALQDLDRSFHQSLVSWQQSFNASTVEVQMTQAIQQWNSTALFPIWTAQWQELRTQQVSEAAAWRDSLHNESQGIQQVMKNFTIDQTQLMSQQMHTMLAGNVSLFNETLQSSLTIWFRTWNATKEHIDTSLHDTISHLTTAVHRNVSLLSDLVNQTHHAVRVDMSSFTVNVSNSMSLLQDRFQQHVHILQQNMTTLQGNWERDMNAVQSNISTQLRVQDTELQRLLQTDANQRWSERQNFTDLLQTRLYDQSQQLLSWQAQWRNRTDAMVQQVHQTMHTVQKDVTNVTAVLTERWMQLQTATALLQQRTTEDHELVHQQQTQSQTQQVALALLQQTHQELVLPQLEQFRHQWRDWSEEHWPHWQQESRLWRQEYAHKTQAMQEAQKVCREQSDAQEERVRRLQDKVVAMEQAEEVRTQAYEARARQQEEEIRTVRGELDAMKAAVERMASEQAALKQQQERMQESLLNQVLLLLTAQSVH